MTKDHRIKSKINRNYGKVTGFNKSFDPFSDKLPHEQHSGTYNKNEEAREARSQRDEELDWLRQNGKVILKTKGRAANI